MKKKFKKAILLFFIGMVLCQLHAIAQTPGSLDTSFGNKGMFIDSIWGMGNMGSIAIRTDDQIIMAGPTGWYGPFQLAKYSADGTPDTFFDNHQAQMTNLSSVYYYFTVVNIPAVSLDSANNIFVTASVQYQEQKNGNQLLSGVLGKLNADGSADTLFDAWDSVFIGKNTTAYMCTPYDNYGLAGSFDICALVHRKDGRVFQAMTSSYYSTSFFGLKSFMPDGRYYGLNTNWFSYDPGTYYQRFWGNSGISDIGDKQYSTLAAICLQPDGKILAGGNARQSSTITGAAMVRFDSTGGLDSSFGVNGSNIMQGGRIIGLGLQNDGKILAADTFKKHINLVRYTSYGSLDSGFGTKGIAYTSLSLSKNILIKVLPDGKIILTGVQPGPGEEVNIMRFNTDGTLDSSYGTKGIVTTSFGLKKFTINSIAFQSDWNLIVSGTLTDRLVNYYDYRHLLAKVQTGIGKVFITGPSSACANSPVLYTAFPVLKTGTYTWSVTGGSIASGQGTDSLTVNWNNGKKGTIKLVENSGTSKDSNSITVSIDTNCVWPGDANSDKVVDMKDLLNIGAGYGKTGYSRPSANINWNAQMCMDWKDTFIHAVNYKHADCNGNGIINNSDTLAIHANYSKIHSKTITATQGKPTDPPLYVVFNKDSAQTGDMVKADIMYGTKNIPAKNIYGLAFSVIYDETLIEFQSGNPGSSWIAGKTLSLVTNPNPGQVDMAMVRTNLKDTSGYGKLATLYFKVATSLPSKMNLVSMEFANNLQVNSGLDYKPTYLVKDSILLKQTFTGIRHYDNSSFISISPNPTSGKLNIQIHSAENEQCFYIIHSLDGREILNGRFDMKDGGNNYSISLEAIPPGIYILSAKTKDAIEKVKFVKE